MNRQFLNLSRRLNVVFLSVLTSLFSTTSADIIDVSSVAGLGSDPWITDLEHEKLFNSFDLQNSSLEHSINSVSSLIGKGEFDKAIGQLQFLEATNPSEFRIFFLKSVAYYGQFRYSQALKAAEKCIKIAPKSLTAHWLRGNVLTAQRNLDSAIDAFNDAVRLDPRNPLCYRQRAIFRINYLGNEPNQLRLAIEDLAKGAKLGLSPLAENGLLGSAYRKMGDNKRAEMHFKKVIALEPNHYHAINNIVEMHDGQGNFQQSEPWIRRAENSVESGTNPDKAQVAMIRARHTIAASGAVDVVEKSFRTALKYSPEQASWCREFAVWLEQQGRQTDAVSVLRNGLAVSSRNPDLAAQYAWALADSGGNTSEARKWMKIARAYYPENLYMNDTEAWIEYRDGNHREALKKLTPSLHLAKQIPEIAYHAGAIYNALGEQKKAIDYLNLAMQNKRPFNQRLKAKTLHASLTSNK